MTSPNHLTKTFDQNLHTNINYSPSPPKPLGAKLERIVFPIDALGKELKTYLLALHTVAQAPLEICFASLFSALNHAVQALVVIKLPQGQVKPVSCFFITIADSGERKTRADDDALKGTELYQNKLLETYTKQKSTYKNQKSVYDEEKKKILQDKTLSSIDKNTVLNALGEPKEPRYPILVTGDPTMEGLIKLFYNGYPFVMLSTSEGGEFFGGHANNKDNHLKTLAKLSRLWDGAPIDQVRKDSELLFLKDQRLNVHISVQHRVFEAFMGHGMAEDQGFLSRVFLSAPNPLAGSRAWMEPEDTKDLLQALDPFYDKVLGLYGLVSFNEEDPTGENPQGNPASGLKLREMSCPFDVLPPLKQFYEYGESRIGLAGVFQDIKDFVSKSQENVLRIATTLTVFENPEAVEVTLDSIKTAIHLVNFYISEQLFVRSSGGDTDEEILLGWLHKKYPDGLFERRIVLQNGPKKLRKACYLDPVLASLQELGYIKESSKGSFRLVPLAYTPMREGETQ